MLTRFAIYGIIKLLNGVSEKYGNVKFEMEVYADKQTDCSFSHCKSKVACTQKKEMEKLNFSLRDITNSFIQLFFKTEKKYSCTQTKLGKLVSILAFKFARNGILVFNDSIYKYLPNCGTFISALNFIPKDIYIRDFESDDPDNMSDITEAFNEDAKIPVQYTVTETIPPQLNQEIKTIFIKFGTYPATNLGDLLNPIVNKISNGNDTEPLDILRLSSLTKNDFIDAENNKILEYIYTGDLNNGT